MKISARHLAIALVSAASLIFEVSLTRILSFTLWYHFAFLVVGVALLGSAAAGSWLASRRENAPVIEPQRWALILALTLPVAHALFQVIPFEPFALSQDPWQILWATLGLTLLAAPFFASGVTIASLLSQAGERPFSIYAADLVGAALGAALTPALMSWLGAPSLILVAAISASLSALLFTRSGTNALAASAKWQRRATWGVFVLLCLALPRAEDLLPWRVSEGKKIGQRPAEQVLRDPQIDIFHAWDIASRVDVLATRQGARILIDGGTAMTRVPLVPADLNALDPIFDVNAAVLAPARDHAVLVVGAGGGWEVLRALSHGAASVDAVEINGKVVDWVRQDQRFGAARLFSDPRVRLIHDEARAFLTGHPRRYRAILMIHTISNAAMGAGAMSLAENYILTREAFALLLHSLDDEGLLLVTRPDVQLPRLRNTVQAALAKSCPDLDACAMAFVDPRAGGFFSGLLVAKQALSAQRRSEIATQWQSLGLQVLAPSNLPVPPKRSLTQPSTDDQPFFSQRVAFADLRWADLQRSFGSPKIQGHKDALPDLRMSLEQQPIAELAVLGSSAIALFLGLIGIVVPLLIRRRSRAQLSQTPGRIVLRFAAMGLGFLFVEIGLMQQLTRSLGQPSLAFALVLASILVGAGLSSQLLAPRVAKSPGALWLAFGQAAGLCVVFALGLAPVLDLLASADLLVRIVVGGFLGLLLGVSLGIPFPVALSHHAARAGSVTWAFAVNGFASVAAPALAIVVSAQWGLRVSLLFAAVFYTLGGILPESKRQDGAKSSPK